MNRYIHEELPGIFLKEESGNWFGFYGTTEGIVEGKATWEGPFASKAEADRALVEMSGEQSRAAIVLPLPET